MSTHPCPTCGHVHEAPPTVDWTGYENAVREYIAAWTAEQQHLLDCWRERVPSEDRSLAGRRRLADERVEKILSPITRDRGYIHVNPATGEVLWRPYLGDGRLTLYTHADGPIRPDGAA
jgi:hypothetical protein